MSHIPNSAIPHAGTIEEGSAETQGAESGSAFGQLAEKVRENPKTAIAAGAAVAAGVVGAATLVARNRRGRSEKN